MLEHVFSWRTPIARHRRYQYGRFDRAPYAAGGSGSSRAREPISDQDRFSPLGEVRTTTRRARGLEVVIFDLPKKAFVLPYDPWLRRGMSKVVDQMMRDPVAIAPTGLNPDAVTRLWLAFLDGAPIYWSRVWAIYVFIWWCHRYKVYI